MNEFIMWDKIEKEWLTTGNMPICSMEETLIFDFSDSNEVSSHLYIGKTDIYGNKIYADSSIVEFEYEDRIPTLIDDDVIIKFTAYFEYNIDELRCELIILDYDRTKTKSIYSVLSYNMDLMKNLKVIGTLQENQELLGVNK